MTLYSKYLEDNLNDKFKKSMEEYRKYLKMFYTENSKCPIDSKALLDKEETKDQIKLWCKGKGGRDWSATIKKPVVVNLNNVYGELNEKYINNGIIFKNDLKENMLSPMYVPEKDKEIEKKLKNLKEQESELESVKEIFKKEQIMIDDILKKRQLLLVKLLEIKINKENIYRDCPVISAEVKRKLMEIAKNEKTLSEQRLKDIGKNTNLKPEEVKNWIKYFAFIMEYLHENNNLNILNNEMIDLRDKFDKINTNFILEPPDFDISSEPKTKKSEDEDQVEEKFEKRIVKMRK